jgi:hypothetical protein
LAAAIVGFVGGRVTSDATADGAWLLDPAATPGPRPAVPFEDAAHRFRVEVPEGWTIRSGDLAVDLRLEHPGSNSGISVRSEPWCSEATLEQAERALEANLPDFQGNTGFEILEPIEARFIQGHPAARFVFTHFLANGRAYQTVAVVLGPEWSTGWVYSGLVHDASEIGLWADINATLDSFVVLPGPGPARLTNDARHFSLEVPSAWQGRTEVPVGPDTADAVLVDPRTNASVVVVSESRVLRGTPDEARSILQEALDEVATAPGFRLLEPVVDGTVDGHPAAAAFLTWQPSTYDVNTVIAVVVGSEWQRFWGLSGSAFSWMSPGARTCFNATLASFELAEAPLSVAVSAFFLTNYVPLLAAGLGATSAIALAVIVSIARSRTRAS